jgi:uncharacterized protein (TIGR02099 family)
MTATAPPTSSRAARVVLGLAALAVALAGLGYLAVRWVVWPQAGEWRDEIAAQIGRQLQRPVSIAALRPGWDGLHPTLAVDGLRVDGDDGLPRLQVPSAFASLSWRSLVLGRPRLSTLRLASPNLMIERLGSRRFAVGGLAFDLDGGGESAVLDRLLEQGEVVIADATIELVDRLGERPPQRIDRASAALRTTGRHHWLAASSERPGTLASSLALVADLQRPPLSRASDWRRWRGEVHVAAHGADLAPLLAWASDAAPALPPALAGARGTLDARGWVRFDDARLLDAALAAEGAGLDSSAVPELPGLRALQIDLAATRQRDGGIAIRVGGLSATDETGFSLAADGDGEVGLDPDGAPRSAWMRMRSFDAAAALAALRRLPLAAEARARLASLEVSGTLRDPTVTWTRPDTPVGEARPADRSVEGLRARAAPRLEVSAHVEGLSLRPRELSPGRWRPGFDNLSGTLRVGARDGSATLSAANGSLTAPAVFDDPTIPFQRLDADISWTIDPARGDGWLEVAVPRFAVENADGRAAGAAAWRSGGRVAGILDLSGRIERVEGRRVLRYVPLKVRAEARRWLDRAVVGGVAEDVTFAVRGDLYDFPFNLPHERGLFRIAGRVRDGTLAYAPDWPPIDQIRGELVFEGAGLEVRAQSGRVGGVRLADVHARLPYFKRPLLTVEGRGAGPAQEMLRFVDASPIGATVSTFTRDLRIDGDARLALQLTLPIDHLEDARASGVVDLAGNDMVLDRTLPPFTGVTGRLEFSEAGLVLPAMRAEFLGGPLRVEGRAAGAGRMRIEASGTIDAEGMRRVVDNPLTRRLDGRTDYRATVDVDRRASTLRIESDLVGLASRLPEPFHKPAGTPMPLRVVGTPVTPPAASARPPGDRLDVRLGGDIALAVERERERGSERLRIRRAGFAVGAEPPLRERGLSVIVRARALDLDAWRDVLADVDLDRMQREAGDGLGAGVSLMPELVSVVADDLRVAGRDLHEVVLGASRLDGRWRANVASREVQGQFEWHDARPGERIGSVVARFDRLVLPRSRVGEVESALSAAPGRLPALDVTVSELVLGSVPMGRLTLSATNGGTDTRPVWTLRKLALENPAATLQATGSWAFPASGPPAGGRPAIDATGSPLDPRRTALDFTLAVRDGGALLARLGVPDALRGGSGTLAGNVHWHGSPVAIDYASLDGQVRLDLGKGAFLKADPGAAKLIGVLNMQALPKRLAGDFRDLFGEGFAFDSLAGDVRLEDGIARTDGLRMRGLQAQVRIRGEADLHRETQRLQVEVVPELNAGLASVAVGAIVNPVFGLGSLAAQYVLARPLQDALAYEVDVTGSWSDPAVSERHRRAVPASPPANSATP